MDISGEKAALRAAMKKTVAAMPADERMRQSAAVCGSIARRKEFIEADTVLVYSAMEGECDPAALVRTARAMGKEVVYPKCEGDELGLYLADEGQLVPGAFGIMEPGEGCKSIRIEDVDIAIVPGVAFDGKGSRLGRGKGYYDRLLKNSKVIKVGICFNEQLLNSLPTEAHDGRMDIIAAENWDILLIK